MLSMIRVLKREERREELVPSMFNHCLENFGGVGVVL